MKKIGANKGDASARRERDAGDPERIVELVAGAQSRGSTNLRDWIRRGGPSSCLLFIPTQERNEARTASRNSSRMRF